MTAALDALFEAQESTHYPVLTDHTHPGPIEVDAADHLENCGCLRHRISVLLGDDRGMSTLEYAMGALSAMALAAALYLVVSSGTVSDALESIITDALNNRPA